MNIAKQDVIGLFEQALDKVAAGQNFPPFDPTRPRNLARPVSLIQPRLLREQDAACYVGASAISLRRKRAEDSKRIARGEEPEGPRWLQIGRSIRYDVRDLDDWVNSFRVDPAQGDDWES